MARVRLLPVVRTFTPGPGEGLHALVVRSAERALIQLVLARTQGNRKAAATLLGVAPLDIAAALNGYSFGPTRMETWRTPDGVAARLDAADRSANDRTAALPSPHGCELVLAATLGDLAGGSAHTPKPRATLAALHSVTDRWQARGDVTPFGETLIRVIDRQGVGPRGGR